MSTIFWTLAVIVLGLAFGGFLPGTAIADDDANRAGLVVDYGDGTVTYAIVEFAEDEVSGIELLRLSGIPLVTVDFGGLGAAVCTVRDRGCGIAECRQRVCQTADAGSPYWRYFRLASDGEWAPMNRGASASTVVDGDVDGWSWTGRDPELPTIALSEIEAILAGPGRTTGGGSTTITIDSSGQVLEDNSTRFNAWKYASAVALIGALSAALIVVRARVPGSQP
ncbi:hypothetical protein BH23CHL5_BH23CHL5_05880 [soil metagenome]